MLSNPITAAEPLMEWIRRNASWSWAESLGDFSRTSSVSTRPSSCSPVSSRNIWRYSAISPDGMPLEKANESLTAVNSRAAAGSARSHLLVEERRSLHERVEHVVDALGGT